MHNSLLQFTWIIAGMVWFMIFQLSQIKVVFSNPQYGERERERERGGEKTNKCWKWENFLINLRRNDNQSGSILFRFSWICNVLWDHLKANISRIFRIYHIPLLKLFVFYVRKRCGITARQTGTNLLNTKSSHDTTVTSTGTVSPVFDWQAGTFWFTWLITLDWLLNQHVLWGWRCCFDVSSRINKHSLDTSTIMALQYARVYREKHVQGILILKEDKNKQKGNTENPLLTSPGNCLI